MAKTNKLKIFNDPIYGFIGTPNEFIFNLIAHPYFQRLRRISQMGLSYLVYPGAHHTRFHHALGCMHLMQKAIDILRYKGVAINREEENGLLGAILLHDIGHGPFSHALEHILVPHCDHEELSLIFMEHLNREVQGELEMALSIFKKQHPKAFLNQLVSGQLDMDRMDYLKRDSFYTGVTEGNISSERLITMLNVHEGKLVIEEKGLYSVEKFLMARRFMYWQVYLHKTSLVAEQLLIKLVQRARDLLRLGKDVPGSPTFQYFLKLTPDAPFTGKHLHHFSLLDDVDVLGAIKLWQHHEDFILSTVSKMLLYRNLLKIKVKNKPIDGAKLSTKKMWVKAQYPITEQELDYFVFEGKISNQAYNAEQENINILTKGREVVDVAEASDHLNLVALSKAVIKYYACYPKKSV
ncbi:MAG: HD domain-containing protein [Bacteroidota bacterium]